MFSQEEKKEKGIWQERLDPRSEIGSGNKISSRFIRKKENVAMEIEASQNPSCGIIIQKMLIRRALKL